VFLAKDGVQKNKILGPNFSAAAACMVVAREKMTVTRHHQPVLGIISNF